MCAASSIAWTSHPVTAHRPLYAANSARLNFGCLYRTARARSARLRRSSPFVLRKAIGQIDIIDGKVRENDIALVAEEGV